MSRSKTYTIKLEQQSIYQTRYNYIMNSYKYLANLLMTGRGQMQPLNLKKS